MLAGVVVSAAELLSLDHLEVSVRCLMVLGMLLSGEGAWVAAGRQQLAAHPAALQQLLALLKQSDDMDCKVIARDLLGLLHRDEELRPQLEAALRQSQQQQQQQGDGAVAES